MQNMAAQGMTEKMRFGNLIASLRRKKGMTAKELAGLVGVSPPAVTQWEHSKRRPEDVGIILRLLTVLEATDEERREILTSIGYKEPLTQNLDDVDLLQWVDGKFDRITTLREETTDQIEDLKRIFQQQLLGSVKKISFEQLLESAETLGKESRYREAAEKYDEACSMVIKEGVSKYQLAALYEQALWANYVVNQFEKCVSLAKKIILLYEREKISDSSLPLASAYEWLGALYCEFGDYKLAQQYADENVKLGIPSADIYGTLGTIKVMLGQWQEAEDILTAAVDWARKDGKDLEAMLNIRAWFYIKQERLLEAQNDCLESLDLRLARFEAKNPRARRALAHCTAFMADIHMLTDQPQWHLARMCLTNAIDYFSQIGDSKNAAEQYYNLTTIALEQGDKPYPQVALGYARRFVEFFRNTPFKVEQARGKRLMGKVYAEFDTNGSSTQAQELLRESVYALRSIGNKYELGLSCYELGSISKKVGQQEAAVQYLMESKSIFQSLYIPGKNGLENKIKKVEEALTANNTQYSH
jgi:transcriptional regulator with XRE-family HTH domain